MFKKTSIEEYTKTKRSTGIAAINLKEGDSIANIELMNEEDIVIADDTQVVGLAGVMGGLSTEIEDNTKNILIEAAIFNGIKIRKTAKKILRSEASNRFEKGIDYTQTYMAIERCCHLLEKYADAKVVTGLVKYDTTEKEDKKINITAKNIKT